MTATPEVFSRLNLYTVLHSLPDGVTLANAEGRIVFSNRAADQILGVTAATDASPDEWAEHYGVFLPDGETPFPTDRYPLVRALKGEITKDVEMLVRNPANPDGALISVSGRQLFDADGAPIGAAVVFRDITELRRAQRGLEEAIEELTATQRLKDEILSFVVHDLKSPLTAIIATSDLLLTDRGDQAQVAQDIEDIKQAAVRINDLVLDLLDVQMAEDGQLELSRSDVGLADLFEEVRRAVRGWIGDPERLVVGDAGELAVDADRGLLLRLVLNLIDNCVKYGPEDGKIWIEAVADGGGPARIAVSDEGPGVPEHLREKVFEKYARVERVPGFRSAESRGLGLRFCKVVADAHGWGLWVEDAEPRGARFCVELTD